MALGSRVEGLGAGASDPKTSGFRVYIGFVLCCTAF